MFSTLAIRCQCQARWLITDESPSQGQSLTGSRFIARAEAVLIRVTSVSWGFDVDQEAAGRSGSQRTTQGIEQETDRAEGQSYPILALPIPISPISFIYPTHLL
jgi:hypothetical protein